ncbi:MAG TPA: protein translocase subunit SecF [Bdellovibrionota bacterium]|nr:protein translocase subunit SecF [Bdellovibrionota bacterium]
MRFIKQATHFDFIGHQKFFWISSGIVILASILCLAIKGLNFGVDFAGGTSLQVVVSEDITIAKLRDLVEGLKFKTSSVQSFGDKHGSFLIRVELTEEGIHGVAQKIENGFKQKFPGSTITVESVESVGPKVGEELKRKGVLALVFSLMAILIYVAIRFNFTYSPGGIVALIHDVIVTLGFISFFQVEFDIVTLAAILTIIGYSINDTIVIYDRIRENIPKMKGSSIVDICNKSLNETLSRTVLTSGTVLLTVSALFFLGGSVIHPFAFAMLVGVLAGTYSTIGIATPVFLWLHNMAEKRSYKK